MGAQVEMGRLGCLGTPQFDQLGAVRGLLGENAFFYAQGGLATTVAEAAVGQKGPDAQDRSQQQILGQSVYRGNPNLLAFHLRYAKHSGRSLLKRRTPLLAEGIQPFEPPRWMGEYLPGILQGEGRSPESSLSTDYHLISIERL